MSDPTQRQLLLGSTSPYRRDLLARLRIPFEVAAPEVDETAYLNETPKQLACRLAMAKARAVAARFPSHVVIGSDQVADLDGLALGKPGTMPGQCCSCSRCGEDGGVSDRGGSGLP